MIRHVIFKYETIDGKIFTDEGEACRHESAVIYKRSGFRFYDRNRRVIKDIEKCYDEADYFTVDHSKVKENKVFIDMAEYHYGWFFPDDILDNVEAKRYRYDDDECCWKPVSRKKAERE